MGLVHPSYFTTLETFHSGIHGCLRTSEGGAQSSWRLLLAVIILFEVQYKAPAYQGKQSLKTSLNEEEGSNLLTVHQLHQTITLGLSLSLSRTIMGFLNPKYRC